MGARYYDPGIGRFLSQDSVFWEIGQTSDGIAAINNPQAMNSYGYAGNNPVTNRDPDGRFWWKEFYTDWKGYDVTSLSRDNGLFLKAGEVLGGRSAALSAISNNAGAIRAASESSGVSQGLIKGIIYEEQSHQFPPFGGEAALENVNPQKYSGGIGVMQVSSKTSGLDQKSLLNPSTNISSGTGILTNLQDNGYSDAGSAATRYNNEYGGAHAERYGSRVDSYVSHQTYNPNFVERVESFVNSVKSFANNLFR